MAQFFFIPFERKFIAIVFLFIFDCSVYAFNVRKIFGSIPNPVNFIPQNKCIEDLGCFYTGPPFFHPMYRPMSLTPVEELKTKYLLFTPSNQQKPEEISPTVESVSSSAFDSTLPTKIIIHGFMAEMEENDSQHVIKDALLRTGQHNVILLYWTEHNGNPYNQAVANARVIGAQAAKLIKLLVDYRNIAGESVHCIGHSLGAQMCGWIGERMHYLEVSLGRITGLDPAGPYFRDPGSDYPSVHLDSTDANFVDVIHTDMGGFVVGAEAGLGIDEAVGHLDFYPNGGRKQPGCIQPSNPIVDFTADVSQQFVVSTCDHSRSFEYFAESVSNENCNFTAVNCDSFKAFNDLDCTAKNSAVVAMGINAKPLPNVKKGAKFYLETNSHPLFCKGE